MKVKQIIKILSKYEQNAEFEIEVQPWSSCDIEFEYNEYVKTLTARIKNFIEIDELDNDLRKAKRKLSLINDIIRELNG